MLEYADLLQYITSNRGFYMNTDIDTTLLHILPIKHTTPTDDMTEIYPQLIFNKALGTEVLAILHFMGILQDGETDRLDDEGCINAALEQINDCIHTFEDPAIHKIHVDFMNDAISQKEYTQELNALKLPAPKASIIIGAFFISAIHFYNVLRETIEHQFCDENPTQAYLWTNNVLAAQKQTCKIFERFDRLQPGLRSAMETAQKKTAVKHQVWEIIRQHNLGRPSRRNPINQMCATIKRIYLEQTGTLYPNTDKTLENHIYDCPSFPR